MIKIDSSLSFEATLAERLSATFEEYSADLYKRIDAASEARILSTHSTWQMPLTFTLWVFLNRKWGGKFILFVTNERRSIQLAACNQ